MKFIKECWDMIIALYYLIGFVALLIGFLVISIWILSFLFAKLFDIAISNPFLN